MKNEESKKQLVVNLDAQPSVQPVYILPDKYINQPIKLNEAIEGLPSYITDGYNSSVDDQHNPKDELYELGGEVQENL